MKAKAKAKKKRTKFVVAWAEYLVNEHKDQLGCGAFRRTFDTAEGAHRAIMDSIYNDTRIYLQQQVDAEIIDPIKDGDVDEVVRDGLWYDDVDLVKFTTRDIEYVYCVQEIEV